MKTEAARINSYWHEALRRYLAEYFVLKALHAPKGTGG